MEARKNRLLLGRVLSYGKKKTMKFERNDIFELCFTKKLKFFRFHFPNFTRIKHSVLHMEIQIWIVVKFLKFHCIQAMAK